MGYGFAYVFDLKENTYTVSEQLYSSEDCDLY